MKNPVDYILAWLPWSPLNTYLAANVRHSLKKVQVQTLAIWDTSNIKISLVNFCLIHDLIIWKQDSTDNQYNKWCFKNTLNFQIFFMQYLSFFKSDHNGFCVYPPNFGGIMGRRDTIFDDLTLRRWDIAYMRRDRDSSSPRNLEDAETKTSWDFSETHIKP